MIAIDCGCGHHMEAENVDKLFACVRHHVDGQHSDLRLSDKAILQMIEEKAYSLAGEA